MWVLLNLGIVYMYSGKYEEAKEMFVRLTRSKDVSHRSIGRCWLPVIPLYLGKLQLALEISKSSIEEDAEDHPPGIYRADKHLLRAAVFRMQRHYELALE